MSADDIAFIKAVVIMVLMAGIGLSIYRLRLRYRQQPSPELEREVAALGEDNAALRAALESRLDEVEERLDFAERQLVQRPPEIRVVERPARTPV